MKSIHYAVCCNYTHRLNVVTLGNVCAADGDSGRMSAQAVMFSPFFSTKDLKTTNNTHKT